MLGGLALLAAARAWAQPPGDLGQTDRAPQVSPEPESYTQGLLFAQGRRRLADRGIDARLNFVTESSGGLSGVNGARFTEQIELGLKIDMAKFAAVPGGSFNLVLTNREGGDLSTDKLHNLFRTQEVYGANKDMRLVYLTWEQTFADHQASWLVGRTNVAQDFAASKLWCNFQNNGLCGRPRSLPANNGFSNYPQSAWGTRLRWKPAAGSDSYVQIGAFEANPNLSARNGFQFSFKHDTGVTLPVEGGLVLGREAAGTLGTYKVGGYYDTSAVPDQFRDLTGQPLALTGRPARVHDGRATGYAFADQMVARLNGDPKRPVTLLGGATYAPADRSMFEYEWYVGALVNGLFASRAGDVFGVMVLRGQVSPDLIGAQRLRKLNGDPVAVQSNEMVGEVIYTFKVARWLRVTPGLQYIRNPAADVRRQDAVVLDFKTNLDF